MLEINFYKIKFWAVIILVQIICFATGVFAGKYYFTTTNQNLNTPNFNTNQGQTTTTKNPEVAVEPNTSTNPSNNEACYIKGNISSKTKIYHMPGGSFYERTDPEMCFNSEGEAQAAGFTKSSR